MGDKCIFPETANTFNCSKSHYDQLSFILFVIRYSFQDFSLVWLMTLTSCGNLSQISYRLIIFASCCFAAVCGEKRNSQTWKSESPCMQGFRQYKSWSGLRSTVSQWDSLWYTYFVLRCILYSPDPLHHKLWRQIKVSLSHLAHAR